MTLLLCWVLFGVVMAALSVGCGLLLEAACGWTLPGALLAPVGLALVVVATELAVAADATAELATPLVISMAVAGFAVAGRGRLWRPDGWALGTAAAAFAVFALPVVLSGLATFAGYVKLDDTATWLAMTDRVMEHGRNLQDLAPSTYEATLQGYLGNDYPVGSFLPLGIAHTILGEDSAWLFQPMLAFYGAMLCLTLYSLAAPIVASRPWRAVIAFAACQPALLFGYSLWGGIKELAGAWILAVVAATLVYFVVHRVSLRSLLAPAVACAATLSILSAGGGVWLAPPLLAVLAILLLAGDLKSTLIRVGAFAVLVGVLSLPPLLSADAFLSVGQSVLTSETELGNLAGPLNGLQVLGIWPVGDFRYDPENMTATHLLLATLAASGVFAVVMCLVRRAWGPLLLLASAALGCLVVTRFGSPWVDGKALTTASPAFLFAALIGAALVYERGRRVEAAVIAAALVGGVLWGNVLAYREVNLAPRDRLAELEKIGGQIEGEGPTLMTDYEPYGTRHFLRDADPEGVSEFRRRTIPLLDGRVLTKLELADVDEIQPEALLVYRTLVLRPSPFASRPPSAYSLKWRGEFYEVWQRPELPQGNANVRHLALGDKTHPSARPDCQSVLRLARFAGPDGRLAGVPRPPPVSQTLSQTGFPQGWRTFPGGELSPLNAGTIETRMSVPRTGRYGVWLGGAFRREVTVAVDGRETAARRHELSHAGYYQPMGELRLRRGPHRVTLRYGDADLRPGSEGQPFPLGPLVLSRTTAAVPVTYISTPDATRLCGRRLDWIEALRR